MTDRRSRKEKISYICGLGAKVGCEHISEHSTCSDESHKYRFFLFGGVNFAIRQTRSSPTSRWGSFLYYVTKWLILINQILTNLLLPIRKNT
ncbi:hypothetical protein DW972_06285 [Anaerobutyricum hallii]|uniref:Uncharacterized protein n=1 Tax=Anaerobutyricum hallii TaxID=39488 RepID=A0A413PYL8_9FIRM|nr:hypothetical protein DW972_06285 [Anaerobutyricum hallii]